MADAILDGTSLSFAESWPGEDEVLTSARARGIELGCVPIGAGGGATLRFLLTESVVLLVLVGVIAFTFMKVFGAAAPGAEPA